MKQRNVFLKVILAAIIIMVVFVNCPPSGPDNPNNPKKPNNPENPDNPKDPDNPEDPEDLEDPENPNTTGYFILKTTGLKSLFVSDMQVQSESRAVSGNSSLQTLTYINAAGQNSPVYFISPSGKTIVLEVTNFERIDDQRTWLSFDSFYEVSEIQTEVNGQNVTAYVLGDSQNYWYDDKGNYHSVYNSRALIDWSTGKVYDFKDQGYVLFAHGGNLYTYTGGYMCDDGYKEMQNSTVYKIDLNTLSTAIPLNNPGFYPVNGLYASIVLNNKIISRDGYSFDINLAFQPHQIKFAMVTIGDVNRYIVFGDNGYSSDYLLVGNSQGFLIQDLEGAYWYFNVYGHHEYTSGGHSIGIQAQSSHWDYEENKTVYDWDYTQEPYIVCKLAIDDTGQMSVSEPIDSIISFPTGISDLHGFWGHKPDIFFLDLGENGIAKMVNVSRFCNNKSFYNDPLAYRNNGVFILFEKGFVRIRKKAQGLQVDSTALSIPSNLNSFNCFINKDNYLYWLEGAAIKRLYLAAGSSGETVYTNSRIVSSSVTGKTLLTASGSNLIFYSVAENNISVYTYSLPMYQPGAAPKILSTSDVQVRDIVELNF